MIVGDQMYILCSFTVASSNPSLKEYVLLCRYLKPFTEILTCSSVFMVSIVFLNRNFPGLNPIETVVCFRSKMMARVTCVLLTSRMRGAVVYHNLFELGILG
jgi:hypothetical protein